MRCSASFRAVLLLAAALASCKDDESGAQGDLDIYGEWNGDGLFVDFTNTYVRWNSYSGTDMSGDVVLYDNQADFGVILWAEPSALAGQYQKFSWEVQSDTTAVLQLYDEKTSLSEARSDAYMKYDPIPLTRVDELFRGCHGGVCQVGCGSGPA